MIKYGLSIVLRPPKYIERIQSVEEGYIDDENTQNGEGQNLGKAPGQILREVGADSNRAYDSHCHQQNLRKLPVLR